jgi:hypothetical protein
LSEFIGNPITEKYEKKHTVVMIPTILIKDGNADFNPMDKNTYADGIRRMPEYHTNSNTQILGITADKETLAQNHGQLIPPGDTVIEGF